MKKIKITFEKGKRSFNQGIPLLEVLEHIHPDVSSPVVAASLNGRLVDMNTTIEEDATLRFLTCSDPEGLQVFWHSASHIMAHAIKLVYPDAQLGIGPAIDRGFYYDFRLDSHLTPDDLAVIEAKMSDIVKADQPFQRKILSKREAIDLFTERNEPFKVELLQEIDDETISVYENGSFVDLCRGPHVPSTKLISHWKLLSLAGAYWRGDERNAVLQRIYGIAYPDKKRLDDHLRMQEEAIKRDHRRLGKQLDLFSFHNEGPGFPFWHPNGVIVYNEILQYMREVLTRYDYQEIKTPLIMNEALWHRSGHWDNYKENMYFTSIDDASYAVKPMNCPGALLLYKNTPHSYREFPLKLSEMGIVHRHEKSGVLHGLFRVRMFTQDDAHVFCTPDQMEDEIIHLIDLVEEVYHTFGYDDYQVELSTRPPKSIGDDAMWGKAEQALQNALRRKKLDFELNRGEGAFYGPKIDYHIRDSLDRLWQCGTIQVDFSMPERFDLEYVGQDGERHRPVMIHRAILGSIERFLGILIEHVGGAFPLWLAPVQCIILPISEKHLEFSSSLCSRMKVSGIRACLDERNEKIGYKIRESETNKIPYMCIIGDREAESETVSVRKRHEGDLGTKNPTEFIQEMCEEIERRG